MLLVSYIQQYFNTSITVLTNQVWKLLIALFKVQNTGALMVVSILIIHASECISGSATCIEDIYNDANRTSRGGGGGGEFGLHNIVNVRNHVATPLMHEEISVLLVL